MLLFLVLCLITLTIVASVGTRLFLRSILGSAKSFRSILRKRRLKRKHSRENEAAFLEYELWDSTCRDFYKKDSKKNSIQNNEKAKTSSIKKAN